ncbi:tellerium resistance protein [Rhodococcus opacus PD630]|uniref:TerC family protein n=1 Tax=Rhodococcus opacus TaxID=37919 RepID=UPI00029CB8A4|nr:TerC family protein [Rhodococcus opacus]NDV09471.1 TerC family protein [Rhodococcus sp. IEGM 248]AHK29234.1 putative membrane protein [Rhodococcus opacus PD630]EHI45576.1 tellerium resistance protein [Rhodococcus opacus PD630]MDV7088109.1 TerC family protein [Rhodococcus opacus]UDG99025.1 TerC family protein [Rhodococcus opacus PD630]
MHVTPFAWIVTIIVIVALLAFDYFFHVRHAHIPTLREAAIWSSIYVGLALLFGVAVLIFGGVDMGSEYFAGYVTEKALSVDNLFVFLIIMSSFRVPREDQQKVLLFGIVFSIFARTAFIFLGAALINSFAWVFYFFGLILLITAGNMLRPETEDSHSADNFIIRIAKKFMHTTEHYDGDKLFTIENGKRAMTPMLLVMVAIGGTDILFALDSIPAIFGLTQNVFVVFTATVFSLMGLRQLYFLLDGLLDRLIYLSFGLSAILAFIGVKLILHALHENNLPFVNDGEPVNVIEISTFASLAVIIGILVITVIASLTSKRGRAQSAIAGARRHAINYLDLDYTADLAERERMYDKLLNEEEQLKKLDPKFKKMVREETALMDLIKRSHQEHDAFLKQN